MPIYCVVCELTDGPTVPTPDGGESRVRDVLPAVADELAALGPCVQVSRTTWLLAAERTADEVMEKLWPQVLAAGERVVMLPVADTGNWRCHSGDEDAAVVTWLGERLGGS